MFINRKHIIKVLLTVFLPETHAFPPLHYAAVHVDMNCFVNYYIKLQIPEELLHDMSDKDMQDSWARVCILRLRGNTVIEPNKVRVVLA